MMLKLKSNDPTTLDHIELIKKSNSFMQLFRFFSGSVSLMLKELFLISFVIRKKSLCWSIKSKTFS